MGRWNRRRREPSGRAPDPLVLPPAEPALDGRQLYFLHLPKTAGLGLVKLLGSMFPVPLTIRDVMWPDVLERDPDDVRRARFVSGHLGAPFLNAFPQPRATVTFLREPMERAVSQYRFWALQYPDLEQIRESRNFSEFLLRDEIRFWVGNTQTLYLGIDGGTDALEKLTVADGSLYDLWLDVWAHTSPEAVLDAAIERLESLDFVGVQDRYDESVDALCLHLGRPVPSSSIDRYNTSEGAPAVDLTDGDRELLHDLTALDRRLYDHACSLADAHIRAAGTNAPSPAPVAAPLDRTTVLDVTGPVWGENWWPTTTEVPPFRWSGPTHRSTLHVPLALPTGSTVEVGVQITADPANPPELVIEVDGVPLAEGFVRAEEPGVVVGGTVADRDRAATPSTGLTTITIDVPHLRSLGDFDGPAFMDVGIGAVWVRFTPPR